MYVTYLAIIPDDNDVEPDGGLRHKEPAHPQQNGTYFGYLYVHVVI